MTAADSKGGGSHPFPLHSIDWMHPKRSENFAMIFA